MSHIPESDWKLLSKMKNDNLNKLCQRINSEVATIIQNGNNEPYNTYIKVYEHIKKSDKVIASCFENWKRSCAIILIMNQYKQKLITEEQFEQFSETTKRSVRMV